MTRQFFFQIQQLGHGSAEIGEWTGDGLFFGFRMFFLAGLKPPKKKNVPIIGVICCHSWLFAPSWVPNVGISENPPGIWNLEMLSSSSGGQVRPGEVAYLFAEHFAMENQCTHYHFECQTLVKSMSTICKWQRAIFNSKLLNCRGIEQLRPPQDARFDWMLQGECHGRVSPSFQCSTPPAPRRNGGKLSNTFHNLGKRAHLNPWLSSYVGFTDAASFFLYLARCRPAAPCGTAGDGLSPSLADALCHSGIHAKVKAGGFRRRLDGYDTRIVSRFSEVNVEVGLADLRQPPEGSVSSSDWSEIIFQVPKYWFWVDWKQRTHVRQKNISCESDKSIKSVLFRRARFHPTSPQKGKSTQKGIATFHFQSHNRISKKHRFILERVHSISFHKGNAKKTIVQRLILFFCKAGFIWWVGPGTEK